MPKLFERLYRVDGSRGRSTGGAGLGLAICENIAHAHGGKISVADGWRRGPQVDKGERWDPAEVGEAVREILDKSVEPQKVYGT